MAEAITAFLSDPLGKVLLTLIILVLLAVFVFVVVTTVKRLRKLPGGVELDSDEKQKGKSPTVPKDGSVVISVKTLERIIDSCKITYSTYYKRKEDIEREIERKIIEAQKSCLDSAIATLVVDYNDKVVDEKHVTEDDISDEWHILKLYLEHDFLYYMREALKQLHNDQRASEWTEFEINSQAQEATRVCVERIRSQVGSYLIIDRRILRALFETSKPTIMANILNAIQKFVKLSRDKRDALLKAQEEREARLAALIEQEAENDK
jgi:hypothetical protein